MEVLHQSTCARPTRTLKYFTYSTPQGRPYSDSVFCPSSSYAFPLRLYCLSQTPIPIRNFVCKDSPVTLRFPVLPYPSGFPPFRARPALDAIIVRRAGGSPPHSGKNNRMKARASAWGNDFRAQSTGLYCSGVRTLP